MAFAFNDWLGAESDNVQEFASYVVCLIGTFHRVPFVHFRSASDAARYAQIRINSPSIERAYVFGVTTIATDDAFMAVLQGQGELIQGVTCDTLQISERRRLLRIHDRQSITPLSTLQRV